MPGAKFGSSAPQGGAGYSQSGASSSLQGGFDIAERMFYSVKKEWESASRDNMGDVRELIPEFFYLPDFLLNSNHIQLGQTQNLILCTFEKSGWMFEFPAKIISM